MWSKLKRTFPDLWRRHEEYLSSLLSENTIPAEQSPPRDNSPAGEEYNNDLLTSWQVHPQLGIEDRRDAFYFLTELSIKEAEGAFLNKERRSVALQKQIIQELRED